MNVLSVIGFVRRRAVGDPLGLFGALRAVSNCQRAVANPRRSETGINPFIPSNKIVSRAGLVPRIRVKVLREGTD